jgi:predicted SnoaL-like aldol condensation-catalyzing enzyme
MMWVSYLFVPIGFPYGFHVDFVIVHGRFSGFGQPVNWIAADIVRIKDGILVEHWDVIQD